MRATLGVLATAALCALAMPAWAQDGTVRTVDVAHSRASFSIAHLYVTRVEGSVAIRSGSVTMPPGASVPSALEATLDPKHLSTDDADRDDDLQGPDWFDTARYPVWTYASQSIAANANGFTIAGTLTVHGKAQPVTLVATQSGGRYHAVGHASRHGFGMRVTSFDAIVGDDITITLDVALK